MSFQAGDTNNFWNFWNFSSSSSSSVPIPPLMAQVSTLSLPADNTAPHSAPVALPTPIRLSDMAKLRLFASAREAAGTGSDAIDGATVADVLAAATQRYGSEFAEVLTTCRIWVNGNDVAPDTMVGPHDEVAVLPPVSGGST